jgi:glycosyltransferase involved in cell wall biosynthesis
MRLVSPLDYFRLFEFLKICDVAVDPKGSDTGQASGKLLNYMGAGLPVVCFDRVNNRNYLVDGGYFCQGSDGRAISDAILDLMKNPDDIVRKGETNRERSREYGWDKTGQRISSIYNKLQPIADNLKKI